MRILFPDDLYQYLRAEILYIITKQFIYTVAYLKV